MKLRALLTAAALALVLAACGSSSSSSSSSGASSTPATTATSAPASKSPSAGKAVQVTMKNLAFTPSVIHATVGQTVTWTNDDSPPHNVTWVSGPKFASSGTLNTGGKFSIKLTQAGTIHYFCSIHPFMKATIIVGG
ncbi:MAG TPA: cupredoxin domain-containing protein [Solirubrobacteraceae bacterium]|nr:cupredoxin domain-containing protein [Solirubrobacteraceae bacterium]